MRIAWASTGITVGNYLTFDLRHSQILDCGTAVLCWAFGAVPNYYAGNVLLQRVNTAFALMGGSSTGYTMRMENVTFRNVTTGVYLFIMTYYHHYSNHTDFINCLFNNVTTLAYNANSCGGCCGGCGGGGGCCPVDMGVTFVPAYFASPDSAFQQVGAGASYLADGSTSRNAGTTGINAQLLTDLRKTTTYPPIELTDLTLTDDLVLSPQAQRDTDAPDLGYHYDPLDYLTCHVIVTNASVTVKPGTAVACCNDSGLILEDNSSIDSVGTPLAPIWFTRYQAVQEQSLALGPYSPAAAFPLNPYHYGPIGAVGNFRFTRFICIGDNGYNLYHANGTWTFSSLALQDCELWGGRNYLGGSTNTTLTVRNSLFYRSDVTLMNYLNSTGVTSAFTNNLFLNVSNMVVRPGVDNSALCSFVDNAFDNCKFGMIMQSCVNDYNAYINCNTQLTPAAPHNVVLTAFNYASGPLGSFYQSSTDLSDHGSPTADLVSLYHYTTRTTQAKETTSLVDIGYHYVAVNANGSPIDTDGDGAPDYFEDVDGNGNPAGDPTSWLDYDSPNGLSPGNGLVVYTPLK